MKFGYYLVWLSAMIGSMACNKGINRQENTGKLLIEDCEDGNGFTLLGGAWYASTDTSKGGASIVRVPRNAQGAIELTGEGYQSAVSFEMSYCLHKGTYRFKPFVICGFKLFSADRKPFDAIRFKAVSYFFKGPSHLIRVETDDVTDYCFYSLSVPASKTWKKVTAPFANLAQESWGQQVPFDQTAVTGISWQIIGNDGDSSAIWFDDIALEDTVMAQTDYSGAGFSIQGMGIEMKANLYKPDQNGAAPLAIILPGGTSASDIGRVYSYHRSFGELLASKGIAALVLDYSSDKRAFFDTLEINDIGRAVDYVEGLDFVNNNSVFLVGFSIGGANALRIAGSRGDPAGVICYFSPCDWRESGGGYGVKKQPIEYCSAITCPVLILQGDSDKVTDASQSVLLYDSLRTLDIPSELVVYHGAAHGFTYEGASSGNCIYNATIADESYRKVVEFINVNSR